jgi:hypothetical protein
MKSWKVWVLIAVLHIPVATAQAQPEETAVVESTQVPPPAAVADGPAQTAPADANPTPPAQVAPLAPPQRYPYFAAVPTTREVAAPDPPRESRFFAAFVVQNARLLDEDAQLFSKDQNVSGGGLLLLARVRELAPKWVLAAGGDWQHLETQGAWTFGSTSMRSNTFAATAVLRYEHSWWLRPFARLAGGASHNHFSMLGSELTYTDSGWTPFGSVSAGLGIMRAPQGAMPVGLSFDLEGGLSGTGTMDVKPSVGGAQKDGVIPVSGPGIGKQGGLQPMLRLVFGLHF